MSAAWSLVISPFVLAMLAMLIMAASTASAADPLVDWAVVKDVCQTIDAGRQMGGGFASPRTLPALDLETHGRALPLPDAAMPAENPRSAGGALASLNKTTVSLVGLSSSVVPAVTADLVAERKQISVRTVGGSFGQVSGLRLYRPKVGVSVGAVAPDFVGVK